MVRIKWDLPNKQGHSTKFADLRRWINNLLNITWFCVNKFKIHIPTHICNYFTCLSIGFLQVDLKQIHARRNSDWWLRVVTCNYLPGFIHAWISIVDWKAPSDISTGKPQPLGLRVLPVFYCRTNQQHHHSMKSSTGKGTSIQPSQKTKELHVTLPNYPSMQRASIIKRLSTVGIEYKRYYITLKLVTIVSQQR